MKARPRTNRDLLTLEAALTFLRMARENVKAVGAPRTLARIRSAITSLEGAIRNANRFAPSDPELP